jgi:hypothetical protein
MARWRRRILALQEHAEDAGMDTDTRELLDALLEDVDSAGSQLTVCDWHREKA